MNPYSSLCDDFGVYVYTNTKMELPTRRETVLHFFDALQKTFPQMTDFERRENGEFVQIAWDDAIALWAQSLKETIANRGNGAAGTETNRTCASNRGASAAMRRW